MKKTIFYFVFAILSTILLSGYLRPSHLLYSIQLSNTGNRSIEIETFPLYSSEGFSTAGCKMLMPGVFKSFSKYYELPDEELTIHWRLLGCSKFYTNKVKVALPKLFYKSKEFRCINLYFNPDSGIVDIAYRIGRKVINSDGTRFDQSKLK